MDRDAEGASTRNRGRVLFPIAALALTVVMVGCAPSPAPTPTEPPAASETPSATPEPPAVSLTIPDCETLVPLPLAQSLFGASTEFFGDSTGAEFGGSFEVAETIDAAASASQLRRCSWGVPNSDGFFSLLVAELTPADGAELEAALTAAGFSSVTMGTVTGFDAEREGLVSLQAATHLFTGDVWILSDGTSVSLTGSIAGSALDALRTANPSLPL